ncbi:DEAD/DEAH box helicase family protein, partial [Clostridioides difficile]|nr:DEAD/DEAH box helicase family protein [Clostridioides difficile]
MEKLNLEWVTDIIGEDYKKWNMEDRHIMNNRNNVFIETQTGTGKTKFIIDKIVPLVNQSIRNKRKLNLLIVCNRINLKRQVKLELLKSNLDLYEFDKDIKKICNSDNTENNIKETFQILDKLSKITNGITVMSYQQLGEIIYYNNFYCNQHKNNLNFFDFIVFDECHFMLSDLEFNTKCNLIFNELVLKEYSNSFRIFLSATLYELKNAIDFNARLE